MESPEFSHGIHGVPRSCDAHKTKDMSDIIGIPVIELSNYVEEPSTSSGTPVETEEGWTVVSGKWSQPSKETVPESNPKKLLQLTESDVSSEIKYWESAVGFPMFENKPLVVRPWSESCSLLKERVHSVPIWLRLCRLPLKFWSLSSLEKLAGLLGNFLKRDAATEAKTRLGYARLLVEVEIGQDIPEDLIFLDEKGNEIRIQVEYEWKPTKVVNPPVVPSGHAATPPPFGGVTHHDSSLNTPVSVLQQVARHEHQGGSAMVSPSKSYDAAVSARDRGKSKGVNNNVFHHGGRVWLIWNPGFFSVVENGSGDTFYFSVVYGFNEDDLRGELWDHLSTFHDNYPGPWADLTGKGAFFTWNNKQSPSVRGFSRIDRFLINDDWMAKYPDAYVHFLPEGLFDHNPSVCFRRHDRVHRKPPFRYFNMWSMDEHFAEVVQTTWATSIDGTMMYNLVQKLKLLKTPLKALNNNRYSDIEKSVGVAKMLLEDLQKHMHDNPTDMSILAAEREAAAS
ncbi:uncharacterized protein LOC141590328 [Silene latifolia]|uniref:uncharacterized protein LOC141590328 n=1 Tax=Silene latifolia TaxID=37657 RepID=UPI003D78B04F